MRMMTTVVLALVASAAFAADGVTIRGLVRTDWNAEAATVVLDGAGGRFETAANHRGGYRFVDVPAGTYRLTVTHPWYEQVVERTIDAASGTLDVDAIRLHEESDGYVTSCSFTIIPCRDDRPAARFEFPPCEEFEFNTTLIEQAERRDRAMLELLRARFTTTTNLYERSRLARALLGRLDDDQAVFDAVAADAELTFSLVPNGDQNVDRLWRASYEALSTIFDDRRARPLFERALGSSNHELIRLAIEYFVKQGDESVLPLIDAALERVPNDVEPLLTTLATFGTRRAEAVILKHSFDFD